MKQKSLEITERPGDRRGMSVILVIRGQLLILTGDGKQELQGLFELMRGFAMLEKSGAAEAKNVIEILKMFVTSFPSPTYRVAIERLSDEEWEVVVSTLYQ